MSAEDLARAKVERLDVHPGDLVLVVMPDDWDTDRASSVMASFEWLSDERRATVFGVPESLKFKVVRASEQ